MSTKLDCVGRRGEGTVKKLVGGFARHLLRMVGEAQTAEISEIEMGEPFLFCDRYWTIEAWTLDFGTRAKICIKANEVQHEQKL